MKEESKSIRDYKLICHLATGCSNKEAAQLVGVSVSTIERLRKDVDFQEELSKAINEIYRAGLAQISLGIDKAVSELFRILESKDASDRTKLEAIKILLTQAEKAELLALDDRINRIESASRAVTINALLN